MRSFLISSILLLIYHNCNYLFQLPIQQEEYENMCFGAASAEVHPLYLELYFWQFTFSYDPIHPP